MIFLAQLALVMHAHHVAASQSYGHLTAARVLMLTSALKLSPSRSEPSRVPGLQGSLAIKYIN